MGWLPSLKPRQRQRLSLTTDTVDTEATVEDTEAMVDTVLATAGATMASVRLRPNPRQRLSLTTDTVDTEATVEDTEAMVDTVLVTAGATMASVRPRLSPTMAMEAMEDMVDIVLEVTGAMEVTVMAMASNMFPNNSNESYFARPQHIFIVCVHTNK